MTQATQHQTTVLVVTFIEFLLRARHWVTWLLWVVLLKSHSIALRVVLL